MVLWGLGVMILVPVPLVFVNRIAFIEEFGFFGAMLWLTAPLLLVAMAFWERMRSKILRGPVTPFKSAASGSLRLDRRVMLRIYTVLVLVIFAYLLTLYETMVETNLALYVSALLICPGSLASLFFLDTLRMDALDNADNLTEQIVARRRQTLLDTDDDWTILNEE